MEAVAREAVAMAGRPPTGLTVCTGPIPLKLLLARTTEADLLDAFRLNALLPALAAEPPPAVQVNCVAPGLTRMPLAELLTRNAQMVEAIARLHPIPRLGEPGGVASLADFLLSGAASWISGQVTGVDGGRATLRGKG